jgi:Serine/Threonine/Tyrosine Kinase found in polyvalent proteins
MALKDELQDIISGNGKVRHGANIQAITSFLRRKKAAISLAEASEFGKVQETEFLKEYLDASNLWFSGVDESKYIGEGAEQKIYEFADPAFVLKRNDSIFYAFWEDYLYSLLIHNFFFPHLAYELLGFEFIHGVLNAVVKQPFVKATESTDLKNVKDFLLANGFVNKKGNDYFHPGLGLILEDLHDENVLTSDGILQFIDTIFFITDSFYLKGRQK